MATQQAEVRTEGVNIIRDYSKEHLTRESMGARLRHPETPVFNYVYNHSGIKVKAAVIAALTRNEK